MTEKKMHLLDPVDGEPLWEHRGSGPEYAAVYEEMERAGEWGTPAKAGAIRLRAMVHAAYPEIRRSDEERARRYLRKLEKSGIRNTPYV